MMQSDGYRASARTLGAGRGRTRCAAACLYLAVLSLPAHAAPSAPVLPGAADPGRLLDDMTPVPEPALPPAAPVVTAPEVPEPQGSKQDVIYVRKIVIEGVTAYGPSEFAPLYVGIEGQYDSVRRLGEVAAAITARYHADGYQLATAYMPPQDVTEGTITIRVAEGAIDDVTTEGAYRDSPETRAIIARIRDTKPFNLRNLERDVFLLGDLAGVTVTSVLTPPAEGAPSGTSGVKLVFTAVAFPSSVNLDNSGSRYVGPWEFSGTTGVNHLLGPYQQTSLTGLVTSPLDNMQYIDLTHKIPLSGWGTALTFDGSYSHSEPGYKLTAEQLESDTKSYGMTLSQPLIRGRLENLSLSLSLTGKDVVSDALDTRLYEDKIRILALGTHYDIADRWGGSNLAQLTLSQGLDVLGVRATGSPDLSRADGQSDFTTLSGNGGRLQTLTDTLRLYAAAEGQYAWSPLLSSQQFGFGGAQFGRGYDASQLTGDDGLAASVELRYGPPALPWLSSELFVFCDYGKVWNYNDYADAQTALSAGLGVRFTAPGGMSGSLVAERVP